MNLRQQSSGRPCVVHPAARGLRPVSELAITRSHGDRLKYLGGCRCFKCRRANSDYERERKAAREAGDWNGIVSADRARRHMLKLARLGVGRRSFAAATDVAESVLHDIRNGRKHKIRARTERKILAVTKACAPDSAVVSARQTWRRLDALLEEGFTKAGLSRLLGSKARWPKLQVGRDTCSVRTAARVEAIYRRFMR
jgi:hypothetical protein